MCSYSTYIIKVEADLSNWVHNLTDLYIATSCCIPIQFIRFPVSKVLGYFASAWNLNWKIWFFNTDNFTILPLVDFQHKFKFHSIQMKLELTDPFSKNLSESAWHGLKCIKSKNAHPLKTKFFILQLWFYIPWWSIHSTGP